MVYCKLLNNEIHNSHAPFPKFLHLPSVNNSWSAGDINSTNLFVPLGINRVMNITFVAITLCNVLE